MQRFEKPDKERLYILYSKAVAGYSKSNIGGAIDYNGLKW